VKAQVEKIESVLKSAPAPLPPPPEATRSRFKRLGWNSSSSSISSWQSPVTSLSNALGFSGAQSPKQLSRQNSLASTAPARQQSFRATLSSSESFKERKNVSGFDASKLGLRLPEESSERSSEERKDDHRIRTVASPRRVSKSPVSHSASRYLRTSLAPVRATTPQSARERTRSPFIMSQLDDQRPLTARNPTPTTENRSLLARVASPFASSRPKSTPAKIQESDSSLGSNLESVAINAFPKSRLTVKRMSSSMIQRSKQD
jgi:hypothetical protein